MLIQLHSAASLKVHSAVMELVYCSVALSLLSFVAAASAQEVVLGRVVRAETPPPTPTTYEARERTRVFDSTLEQPSLVLPWVRKLDAVRPQRRAADEQSKASSSGFDLPSDAIWRVVRWNDDCEEFLRRFDELHRDFQLSEHPGSTWERSVIVLSFWCEKHGLPDAAEFLMREVLYLRARRRSIQPESDVKRWRSLATRVPSPYTFLLPVTGEWHVLVDQTRHHQRIAANAFAFDLLISAGNGTTFRGANVKENHLAWNQPLFAVADGIIVDVVDRYEDHPIGAPSPRSHANYVQLDCGGGIYAFYAHLQRNSVLVRAGERVQAGQILARVGNSGASGAPHLHFAMLDYDGFSLPGRYAMQVFSTTGWQELPGRDLQEGWHFKPMTP